METVKPLSSLESLYGRFLGPSGLDLILDGSDADEAVTEEDIKIAWFAKDGVQLEDPSSWKKGQKVPSNADAIQFDMTLGGIVFSTGIDIPLDLDFPAFSLNVDGGFEVEMQWSFDFGFGVSLTDGFYLSTNQGQE